MERTGAGRFRISIHNGLSDEHQRAIRAAGGKYWEAHAGFGGRLDTTASSVMIEAVDGQTALEAVRTLIGDESGERAWRVVEMGTD